MKDAEKLARLAGLARMALDLQLAALRKAAEARQASLDRLADLERPEMPTDLSPTVVGEVSVRYQRWADHRRAEINQILARQTVTWGEAREAAGLAFGRNEALAALLNRQRR